MGWNYGLITVHMKLNFFKCRKNFFWQIPGHRPYKSVLVELSDLFEELLFFIKRKRMVDQIREGVP